MSSELAQEPSRSQKLVVLSLALEAFTSRLAREESVDIHMVCDAAQAVVAKVWADYEQVPTLKNALLYVRHLVQDERERQRTLHYRSDLPERPTAREDDPGQVCMNRERTARVQATLENLPERMAAVARGKMQGAALRKIARNLAVSLQTVQNELSGMARDFRGYAPDDRLPM